MVKRRTQFVLLIAIAMMFSASAQAQDARVSLRDWTWPPIVVCCLIVSGAMYSIGLAKMFRHGADPRLHIRSIISFSLGWLSLVLALDSPIHELGDSFLGAHDPARNPDAGLGTAARGFHAARPFPLGAAEFAAVERGRCWEEQVRSGHP